MSNNNCSSHFVLDPEDRTREIANRLVRWGVTVGGMTSIFVGRNGDLLFFGRRFKMSPGRMTDACGLNHVPTKRKPKRSCKVPIVGHANASDMFLLDLYASKDFVVEASSILASVGSLFDINHIRELVRRYKPAPELAKEPFRLVVGGADIGVKCLPRDTAKRHYYIYTESVATMTNTFEKVVDALKGEPDFVIYRKAAGPSELINQATYNGRSRQIVVFSQLTPYRYFTKSKNYPAEQVLRSLDTFFNIICLDEEEDGARYEDYRYAFVKTTQWPQDVYEEAVRSILLTAVVPAYRPLRRNALLPIVASLKRAGHLYTKRYANDQTMLDLAAFHQQLSSSFKLHKSILVIVRHIYHSDMRLKHKPVIYRSLVAMTRYINDRTR